eukprot:3785965-Prymnesium_polylepis.1
MLPWRLGVRALGCVRCARALASGRARGVHVPRSVKSGGARRAERVAVGATKVTAHNFGGGEQGRL